MKLNCLKRVTVLILMTLAVPAWSAGLVDNGNGTITDLATGRMWQKQDDNTARNWASANTYCQDLSLGGKNDWRLPEIKELTSIVDYRIPLEGPTINRERFPATKGLHYWSATISVDGLSAQFVTFREGLVATDSMTAASDYVRCVR